MLPRRRSQRVGASVGRPIVAGYIFQLICWSRRDVSRRDVNGFDRVMMDEGMSDL